MPLYIDDAPPDLTGEQRLRLGMLLSDLDREITKERLRRIHPEWSEKRVTIEIIRLAFLPHPIPPRLQKHLMSECDQFRPEEPAK